MDNGEAFLIGSNMSKAYLYEDHCCYYGCCCCYHYFLNNLQGETTEYRFGVIVYKKE